MAFLDVACDMLVLIGHAAIGRIDQQNADVALVNALQGLDDAYLLDLFVRFSLFPDAGRVYEQISLSGSFKERIDRIARSSWDWADDDARGIENPVYQGRFSHVGSTEN